MFYELLGVGAEASGAEVRGGYRKAAVRLHPDKGGDPALFSKLREAYDTLSHPVRHSHRHSRSATYTQPQLQPHTHRHRQHRHRHRHRDSRSTDTAQRRHGHRRTVSLSRSLCLAGELS
eukprot:COSAG02_NODE_18738_length_921_cov_31.452941_1_plen_119_part_00